MMKCDSKSLKLYRKEKFPEILTESEIAETFTEIKKNRSELLSAIYSLDPDFIRNYLTQCMWIEDGKKLGGRERHLEEYIALEEKLHDFEEIGLVKEAEKELVSYFEDMDRWDIVDHMCKVYIKEAESDSSEFLKIKRLKRGWDQARNRLIETNLRLGNKIAEKYLGRGIDLLDLIQESALGFYKGVHKFDLAKEGKLSTFLGRSVKGYLNTALRDQRHNIGIVSLDALKKDNSGRTLLGLIDGDYPNPEETVSSLEREKLIDDCLKEVLDPREQELIRRRFGFNGYREHTQREIMNIFNISKVRVYQLEQRAFMKLRKALEKKGLD